MQDIAAFLDSLEGLPWSDDHSGRVSSIFCVFFKYTDEFTMLFLNLISGSGTRHPQLYYLSFLLRHQNAFTIINSFFHRLADDESSLSGSQRSSYPSFGCAHSVWSYAVWDELEREYIHGPEVCKFYSFWTHFRTCKTFEWAKVYDYDPMELDPRTQR
jgi:hypothetical protein